MLPVEEVLPELLAALETRGEAVLVAPPGAGKTTRVAPALLGAQWAKGGKIILLSPRRLAARAAASRMAFERNEPVGATIGYRVRLDSKISRDTRVEVVTEGVFTRMILDDPELRGVAAVVFDEFHERSLDGDLGLALARDSQSALRSDLKLIVMSATLDAARVASLLGDAPVIVSEGRMFPVRHVYRPRDARARLEDEVATAVRAALATESGSALVFLPGAGEIQRTARALEKAIYDPNVDILPLFGAMSASEQDAAIAPSPHGRRKVVLATSIAETSLTIEGVRIVVDSGLARRPRFEPALGLTRLDTVRASQAAITQRAGRAGRLEPGVAWRLWSEGETRALPQFDRPEIVDADLSGLALDLAAWGVSDPSTLSWLDPPPAPAWNEALALLKRIGALDADGRLTPHGEAVAKLPLPARLGHMVIVAAQMDEAMLASRIAMVLTEQGLGGNGIDLRQRLMWFDREGSPRSTSARALANRIMRMVGADISKMDAERAGRILAIAYPDRVAKVRPGGCSLVNGRAALIEDGSPLLTAQYVVVADMAGAAGRAQVLLASPIDYADVEAMFGAQIETRASATIDPATGALRGRKVRRLGKLVLSEAPLERLTGAELKEALLDVVSDEGLAYLDWDDTAKQTRARVNFMRSLEGDVWPDWSDEALQARVSDWLEPALDGAPTLKAVDVSRALLNALGYEQRRRLDVEAPAKFETPAGSSLSIDYDSDGGPALDVRLQEMFGESRHPTIANGRVPLSVRLLSPAQRPVQTTKDLPGFWRGSYAAVRSEMRGRYPKHPWPDDPLTAPPTRRAKPRGS
ncbi:MAG: ATP-dependent helicase HrpB [Hyphomonadaceae bacterium]